MSAECSRVRGRRAFADRHLSLLVARGLKGPCGCRAPSWSVPGDESFAPTRSARALHVTESLGCRSESRRRQICQVGRSRTGVSPIPPRGPRSPRRGAGSRSPRSTRLHRPPAGLAKARNQQDRPSIRRVALARSARARPARSTIQVACATRSFGVEGRLLQCPAKSPGIRRTRSAFHRRIAGRGRQADAQHGPLARGSPQLLTSLWRACDAFSFTGHGALTGTPSPRTRSAVWSFLTSQTYQPSRRSAFVDFCV